MSVRKPALIAALLGGAALALSACDNGPSAVARKQSADRQVASNSGYSGPAASAADDDTPQVDHRKDPVRQVDGAPMWSSSRKFSAQENAQRAFERNGDAFGTASVDAFVKKAHAFVAHPPKGTLTLKRQNGDTLFYDPAGNVFAIATKDGAPRTMFKPDDGMAYWQEQKDREAKFATRRKRSADDA